MGVRGVNGQGLAAPVSFPAAAVSPREAPPSPGPRTAETVRDTAPAARTGPGPSEEKQATAASENRPNPPVTRSGVRMRLDEASKRIVGQITNDMNEVIKQIPPEELLRIAARIRELQGTLFDRQV